MRSEQAICIQEKQFSKALCRIYASQYNCHSQLCRKRQERSRELWNNKKEMDNNRMNAISHKLTILCAIIESLIGVNRNNWNEINCQLLAGVGRGERSCFGIAKLQTNSQTLFYIIVLHFFKKKSHITFKNVNAALKSVPSWKQCTETFIREKFILKTWPLG